ncbi:MAG: hypothetical protein WCP91_02365 [Candidatus Berkelbacteria bacterium]
MTKQLWTTAIIVITWIATAVAIFQGHINVFVSILLTFAFTFYLIIFGLQRQKD